MAIKKQSVRQGFFQGLKKGRNKKKEINTKRKKEKEVKKEKGLFSLFFKNLSNFLNSQKLKKKISLNHKKVLFPFGLFSFRIYRIFINRKRKQIIKI